MIYFFILLIASLNCVALFFFSFFAVYGDGSTDGIDSIRLFGFVWIAFCTMAAVALRRHGNRAAAVAVAILTLPAGFAAAYASLLAIAAVGRYKPTSPEFKAACKGAGPSYIRQPAARVESIAYDWARGTHVPRTNYFQIDGRNNVSQLSGGLPRFPPAIKFTEGRCCRFEGPPTNGIGPFVHHAEKGEYFGVTELSADALVTYNVSSTPLPNAGDGFSTVELVVTDRRDGELLATLRYVLDQAGRRGCGEVSDGVMDEQAFIRRAVGVD